MDYMIERKVNVSTGYTFSIHGFIQIVLSYKLVLVVWCDHQSDSSPHWPWLATICPCVIFQMSSYPQQ